MPAVLLVLALLDAGPPPAASADLTSAVALFDAGRLDEAGTRFEAAPASGPARAVADHYLGRIRLLRADPERALPLLEAAAREDPARADFEFWLGVACVERTDDVGPLARASLARRARACFGRACELAPEEPQPRLSLLRWFVEAPGIVGGSLARAREEAARLAPLLPDATESVSRALAAASRGFDRGRARFCAKLEECPLAAPPRYQVGLLEQHVGAWEDARATFAAWLAEEPGARLPLYQLGRTGALSGRHLAEARDALARYVAQQPQAGEPPLFAARWRLGQVLARMGDSAGARREYEAAAALAPGFAPARRAAAEASDR